MERACMSHLCPAWPNYNTPHQTSPENGNLSCMQPAFICVWQLCTDPEWLSMQPSSRTVLLTPCLAISPWLVATASILYSQHTGIRISASNYAAWLLQEVGQKVAMHAVAMKPRYLSPDTVPAEALEGSPDTTPLHSCLWEAA